MNPVITKEGMTIAVDGVLAALGLDRAGFENRTNSGVLSELLADFEFASSPVPALVLAQAEHAARELDDYIRKICPRCQRDFYVVAYLAPKRAFDFCRRNDCGK